MTPNIHLPPALASSVAIACRMRALELRHCVEEINRIAAIPNYQGNLEVERARAAALTAEAVALETFAKLCESGPVCQFECIQNESMCFAASPSNKHVRCTRLRGHTGLHSACGLITHDYITWE